MKKSSFLLLILLLFSQLVMAQADFAPVGATWYYGHHRDGIPGYRIQRSVGDTIVAGKPCRRIDDMVVKRLGYNPAFPLDTSYTIGAHFIYANSDTVFYFHKNYQRFVPLYIFNVNIGDTLKYYYKELPVPTADSTFSIVVTDIVTEMMDGHPIRTIHSTGLGWHSFSTGGYIERLGYKGGLDWFLDNLTLDWIEIDVRCYSDGVINYHREPQVICNYIFGGTGIEGQDEQVNISIYPNPAIDHILVRNNDPQNEIQDIALFDVTGRKVFQVTEKPGNLIKVKTDAFSKGTYLLRVKLKQGNVVKKVTVL